MGSSEETSKFDVLQQPSTSTEATEQLWLENPVGDNATEGGLAYRIPKETNVEQRLDSLNPLEILREAIRILRFDSSGFMTIAAALICPVSAILLSNVLVDQSMAKRLSLRFKLVAEATGLPESHFTSLVCEKMSESLLSCIFYSPFFITFSLFAKAAIVQSVAYTYEGKKLSIGKFLTVVGKIWKRLVLTYLWISLTILGCVAVFLLLLVIAVNAVVSIGLSSVWVIYAVLGVGVAFSLVFAHIMIICNLAMVVSILENCCGSRALFRSMLLIKGRIQVGLLIFLGTTLAAAFVEALFEHRVKTLSYGDGSSRVWEGPLLVIMYSFVILIDAMMSCIFYFTCKSSSSESSDSHSPMEPTASFSVLEQTDGGDSYPSKNVLLGGE